MFPVLNHGVPYCSQISIAVHLGPVYTILVFIENNATLHIGLMFLSGFSY